MVIRLHIFVQLEFVRAVLRSCIQRQRCGIELSMLIDHLCTVSTDLATDLLMPDLRNTVS
jgi:hypothetical protein